jgi:hypothetical protein
MFKNEEFKLATGIDLDNTLKDDADPTGKVDRFIDKCCSLVDEFIRSYNKHYKPEELSTFKTDKLKKAEMEQAEYILANSDLTKIGPYDEINNLQIPEIDFDRFISPVTRRILTNAGLLYRGL